MALVGSAFKSAAWRLAWLSLVLLGLSCSQESLLHAQTFANVPPPFTPDIATSCAQYDATSVDANPIGNYPGQYTVLVQRSNGEWDALHGHGWDFDEEVRHDIPLTTDPGSGNRTFIYGAWYTLEDNGSGGSYPAWYDLEALAGSFATSTTYDTNINKISVASYPNGSSFANGVLAPINSSFGHVTFYVVAGGSGSSNLPSKLLAHVSEPATNPTAQADYCLVAHPGGTSDTYPGAAFINAWGRSDGLLGSFLTEFAHDGATFVSGSYAVGLPLWDIRLIGGGYSGQPVWLSAKFPANASSTFVTAPTGSAAPTIGLSLNGAPWDYVPDACTTECGTLPNPTTYNIGTVNSLTLGDAQGSTLYTAHARFTVDSTCAGQPATCVVPPALPGNAHIQFNLSSVLQYDAVASTVWMTADPVDGVGAATCTEASGASTCPVTLRWRVVDGYPQASMYAMDITNAASPVATLVAQSGANTGTTFNLTAGHTYRFEMLTTNNPAAPPLELSQSIVAVASGTGGTSSVTTSTTACVIPNGQTTCAPVTVNWSTTQTSATVYLFRYTDSAPASHASVSQGTVSGTFSDTLSAGSYHYELHTSTTPTTADLLAASGEVSVTGGGTSGGGAGTPIASPDSLSDSVGYSPGEFRVDENGASSYRIPIAVPQGAGSLAPQLELAYSSNGADGPLGTGWQLEGMSTIQRCRQSKEDGDAAPATQRYLNVSYTNTDAFCLDGARLLLVSGSNGMVGATYRTESDRFAKIVVLSSTAAGTYQAPIEWVAYGKDGITSYYGQHTIGSTVFEGRRLALIGSTGSLAASWSVAAKADTNNNAITFSYSAPAAGDLRLDQIAYVGGTLNFSYTPRPDTAVYTFGVGSLQQSQRLTQIDVNYNTILLRSYKLSYQTSPLNADVAHLSSVQECNGTVCYQPSTFSWYELPQTSGAISTQSSSGSGLFPNIKSWKVGDIDGDGRSDVVWFDSGTLRVDLSRPTAAGGLGFDAGHIIVSGEPSEFSNENGWALIDFDGDGKDDLLVANLTTHKWNVYRSLGNGTFATPITAIAADGDGTITVDHCYNDSLIADFNGDGLPDLITFESNSNSDCTVSPPTAAMYVRFLQPKAGGGYQYSARTSLKFTGPFGGSCVIGSFGAPPSQSQPQAFDLDGDGWADLRMQLVNVSCNTQILYPIGDQLTSALAPDQLTIVPPALFDEITGSISPDAVDTTIYEQLFVNAGIQSNGTLGFVACPGCVWQVGVDIRSPSDLMIADINGDGLADAVFRDAGSHWHYALNNGDGMTPAGAPLVGGGLTSGDDQEAELVDYDGDGHLDFWQPTGDGTDSYKVYVWNGNSFSATGLQSQFFGRSKSNNKRIFADLDGDGVVDGIVITSSSGNYEGRRVTAHHAPRQVITQIQNGLGASTNIDYAPMTLSSVYIRQHDRASAGQTWGNGSNVLDVISPRGVVQYVDSSAPIFINPTSTSRVRYYYQGYKVQSGGRGPLGFHAVYSVDSATGTLTNTIYNQGWPLTGTPASTTATLSAVGYTTDACVTDPDASACFADATAPAATGAVISQTADTWTHATSVAAASGPSPQFLYRTRTETWKRDTVGELRHSRTDYTGYSAAHGNLTASASYDFDASGNTLRSLQTTNAYAQDTESPWLIGRLTSSTATVQRGALSTTRQTSFTYDATTGLLLSEVVQPNDATNQQKLTTFHTYDSLGNETQKTTCSGNVTDATCQATTASTLAPNFSPTDPLRIQRYTRSVYDLTGRFANRTYAPVDSAGTTHEIATSTVSTRDPFGSPTQATDANGLGVTTTYGSFGRSYSSTTTTGFTATSKYRWCQNVVAGSGSVTCPYGLAYRIETDASGGPTTWTYFDALGRNALSSKQGFASLDTYAVTRGYDSRGNLDHVSEPFLANGPNASNPSLPLVGVTVYYTITVFDALSRPSSVSQPSGNAITYSYSGLTTTATSSANGSGQVQTTKIVNNAIGEKTSVVDAYNTSVAFSYDAQGNVLSAARTGIGPDNATHTYTTSMTFDALGRKTSLTDPDAGNWAYVYNAAGELIRSVSLSVQRPTCTQNSFDARGRLFARADYPSGSTTACSGTADASTQWVFDRTSHGFGLLSSATTTLNGTALETRTPSYDGFGRLISTSTAVGSGAGAGAGNYLSGVDYDLYGRILHTSFSGTVAGTTLPQTSEQYGYTTTGYLDTTSNYTGNVVGTTYSDIQSMSPRGQVTGEIFAGNTSLSTTRSYYPNTGWLQSISSGPSSLQQLAYTYDVLGNAMSREDASSGVFVHEVFSYDKLQRLLQSQRWTSASNTTLLPQASYSYDGFGDVRTMSEAGANTYVYNAGNPLCNAAQEVERVPGPGALTLLNGSQYCYDPHGNQVRTMDPSNPQSTQKRSVIYYNFDLPAASTLNNPYSQHLTVFRYGADRQRLQRNDYDGITTSKAPLSQTTFLGNAEIIQHLDAGTVEVKRYLDGVVLQISGSTITPNYLFAEGQGSTHRITTSSGALVSGGQQAWTAFGLRADPTTGAPLQAVNPSGAYNFNTSATHHGYTGHEQMDEEGLVHMNGRTYDPQVGRFLQADPFIQSPDDIQSYNRYTYVGNNPLNHTDPTGYISDHQWGELIWGIIDAAIIVGSSGSAAAFVNAGDYSSAALTVGAGGFTVGALQSLSLRGAVLGAFEAEANLGIGSYFKAAGGAWNGTVMAGYEREGQIFSHALLGGVVSKLEGGRFGQGFLSAGVGEALAPGMSKLPPAAGIVTEAVVGGTISELAGGKFANGAISAAFEYAFNEMLHRSDPDYQLNKAQYEAAAAAPGPSFAGWGLAEFLCGFCDLGYRAPPGSGALQPIGSPLDWLAPTRGLLMAPEGAAQTAVEATTRVGRWMSETEFNMMSEAGRVVEGAGGRTYVVNPADPSAFTGAGRESTIYAEFDVPTSALRAAGKPEWSVIPGPNITTRLYGPAPAELAPATCIVCVIRKP
jgi:RHS repeat-associated protein